MPSTYALDTEDSVTINKLKAQQPWVRFSTDHVRCFCNLPQCVTTGYMCKSPGGSCFSNFQDHFMHHSKDYKGKHGCVELLTERKQRTSCEKELKLGKNFNMDQKLENRKNSLIFCCYHDMCNHIDSPQTRNIMNSTLPELEFHDSRQHSVDYSDSQLWFRAATIAVPICGAFILFGLIVLAIKILRNENRSVSTQKLGSSFYGPALARHNKIYDNTSKISYHFSQEKLPIQCHGEEIKRIQVPLLIQNELASTHYSCKNQTNAKFDLIQCDSRQSIILEIEKEIPKCSEINLIQHSNKENKYSDSKYINDEQKLKLNG